MRSDSFASSGEALAKINTYRAANGCNTGIKLPAIARLTMMMENSPRASKVNPVLSEPTVDSWARLPTINPAMTTQTSDSSAAPTASHAAPPKVNGSIERPKPKKKMAPKKSRNGTTSRSIRSLCSVSPSINPSSNAPMDSATWMVSQSPASRNRQAKTTITKSSLDEMRSTRFKNGVAQRPITIKPTMKPRAMPPDETTPVKEVAPLSTMPEMSDR